MKNISDDLKLDNGTKDIDIPDNRESQAMLDHDAESELAKSRPSIEDESTIAAAEGVNLTEGIDGGSGGNSAMDEEEKSCIWMMLDPFVMVAKGWRIYARQPAVFASVGFSFLYMTVLGFDSITVG